MIKSFTVQGYRAIQQELKIKELKKINIFVGDNGSGKSSVFEVFKLLFSEAAKANSGNAYQKFNDWVGVPYNLFSENFLFTLVSKNGTDNSDELRIQLGRSDLKKSGQLYLHSITASSYSIEDLSNRYLCKYISFQNINLTKRYPYLDKVTETQSIQYDSLPHSVKKAKLISFLNEYIFTGEINVKNIYKDVHGESTILLLFDNGFEQNLKSLSDGQLSLINLFLQIHLSIVEFEEVSQTNPTMNNLLLLLEEPETNLHPKYQKMVSSILNTFIDDSNSNVQFFISTHSPFLLSNLSDEMKNKTKVYILDKGKLKTLDSRNRKHTPSHGFVPDEIRNVVADMLGADVVDFGYPANYVILEENSMLQFIKSLEKKKIIRDDYFFISGGSDNKAIDIAGRIESFRSPRTLLTCNPFYQNKFYVLLDQIPDDHRTDPKYIKLIDSIGHDRLIELSKDSLEDYYPKKLKDKFDIDIAEVKGDFSKEGIIKGSYAVKFSDLINDIADFKKYFKEDIEKLKPLLETEV